MKVTKEFQPYINTALNQPRTCLWLEPEDIEEYQMLHKLNGQIINKDKVVLSGFTGIDKQTLLIQFPQ